MVRVILPGHVAKPGGQVKRVLADFLQDFTSFRAGWHPDGERVSVYGTHKRNGLSFWTDASSLSAHTVTREPKWGIRPRIRPFIGSPMPFISPKPGPLWGIALH